MALFALSFPFVVWRVQPQTQHSHENPIHLVCVRIIHWSWEQAKLEIQAIVIEHSKHS